MISNSSPTDLESNNPQQPGESPSADQKSTPKNYRLLTPSDLAHADGADSFNNRFMRRYSIREGQNLVGRFVGNQIITADVHYRVNEGEGQGGQLHVLCNGKDCPACLANLKPVATCFLPFFSLIDLDIGIVTFDLGGGPGSLRAQLALLLEREDYLSLLLEIAKVNRRHRVAILRIRDPEHPEADGMDFGDATLKDILVRGLPSPEDILATFERKSNKMLLADNPSLARPIRLLHPEINLTEL
jgi:hypothetical protein